MRPKRPSLSRTQQKRYWQTAKEKRLNGKELAREVNCTYEQALYILQLGKAGKLDDDKLNKRAIEEVKKIQERQTFDEILEDELTNALAALSIDTAMDPKIKIPLIRNLVETKVKLQKLRLESHLNVTDAGIVAAIIRRYEPIASDERVIEVYSEEAEKWQNGIA